MKFVKVKDFAEVTTGGTPSTKRQEYWEGGKIPWLNSGELNQEYIKTTKNYITQAGLDSSAAKLMPPDSVLIALTGATTGKVGYLTFEACANQSVTGILPSENHIPKYVYYYLNYIRPKVLSDAYGGAQPHISQGYVKDIKIPLPPLEEQKKIAAILDAADELRQKDKALIKKYDKLAQALFLDMFGDPVTNPKGWDLKEFSYFAKFDTQMTKDFDKYGSLPHIGIANIEKETGVLFGYKLVKDENLISGKYLFTPDHIIYSKIRPNLNKVALPTFSGLCSADSYPILPIKENTNRVFLAYLLRSKSFIDFILTQSTRTNIPKANKKQMGLYRGIAPPVTLQNKFSELMTSINDQKRSLELNLCKSNDLFNSLLQKDFKGELTN